MIRALDLMEPEETVGNLWHGWAQHLAPPTGHSAAAVALADLRPSLLVLFRALGGSAAVEIAAAPPEVTRHRRSLRRQLGAVEEQQYCAAFDGRHLRLPPALDVFPETALNRAAYLWLTALAALAEPLPRATDPLACDLAQCAAMQAATHKLRGLCPGLHGPYRALRQALPPRSGSRPALLHPAEAAVAEIVAWVLGGPAPLSDVAQHLLRDHEAGTLTAPRGYRPMPDLPLWLRLIPVQPAGAAAEPDAEAPQAPMSPGRLHKKAQRQLQEQSNRKDSFIIHRFEAILSWVESMNLNRSTDDDDPETAQKAAEDQNQITLTKHDRKIATRLRLHLDLAPQDAEHERLAGVFTYPEWNHRSESYQPDHCRVLEAPPLCDPAPVTVSDRALQKRVRRQFEALRQARRWSSRQLEGEELDLAALIEAQVDQRARGQGSDRIFRARRQNHRDLSVAILMDCSRSTESHLGELQVIEVARQALGALAGGIDALGDRLAIWGFSSLRRDRVFLTRCKGFDQPMSPEVSQAIHSLRPGHYTRLGAALRHVSAQLAPEQAAHRLLLVLTDGKPNDLDHYEGQYGIEDSRRAVAEARALGQSVHGVVIDAEGQDWFARIFGRSGFTLMPDPARLPLALPAIYRNLTEER
jgi:nitric oxide reductase NorD protein